MEKYKYFTLAEFVNLSWDKYTISPILIAKLDKAREYAGIPFIITSAHRTIEQNEACGGVKNSAHLRGLAVDIRWAYQDKVQVGNILFGLVNAGFKRIGLANSFVHCDIDNTLPSPAIWTY